LPDSADEWPFHVDHVIAVQHGGSDAFDNLCWSCSRCNLHKGPNISSIEAAGAEPIALFQPRRDRWEEHFQIEAGRVVGRTPVGRVTVRLLAMNASSRIELRQQLVELGEL
jgi:hypothetical protein